MAFKERLNLCDPQIGLWLALASPNVSELCATAAFDWLLIDAEHGPNDVPSVLTQLQACAAYPAEPVVRVPNHDASLIKRYLDIGVQSLMVPMINSAEEAEAIVAATRYPPQGIRGVGAGLGRVSRWNAVADYLKQADQSVTIVAQIETAEALNNLDEICAVPGIDAVFFGPADIAASIGRLGQNNHKEVRDLIVKGIRTASSRGLASGVYASDEGFLHECRSAGASLFGVASDTGLLASAARGAARSFSSLFE